MGLEGIALLVGGNLHSTRLDFLNSQPHLETCNFAVPGHGMKLQGGSKCFGPISMHPVSIEIEVECLVMKGPWGRSWHVKDIILQQPCMRRANGAVHTYALYDTLVG